MKTPVIRAWHFVGDTLRDGSPIPKDGVWLKHVGPVEACKSGFHASRRPADALKYSPGSTLCLVEMRGDVIEQADKLVARERRIVARMDATEMLRYYARMQALSVVSEWDAPDVVLDYLMTGDGATAARSAAESAARSAAWSAAWSAAGSAARSAAESAARSAAESAARSAAESAAWSAAESAAGSAAESAAWSAARSAAESAFDELVAECFEAFL